MIPLDSFVGQSADGKMVPIIPGGNSIPLTFSNRKEYVERAIEYRLHEMDRQVRWNIWGGAYECLPLSPNKNWLFTAEFWHMNWLFIHLYLYFSPYSETFQVISLGLLPPYPKALLRSAPNWSLVGLSPGCHPGLQTLLSHSSSSPTAPRPSVPTPAWAVRAHVREPLNADRAVPHECLFPLLL